MKRFVFLLFLALIMATAPSLATAFYQNDFNNASAGALSLGGNWKLMSSGGIGNSPAIRLTYAAAGTSGNQATLNISQYNTQELWIEFDTRIEGTMNGGMKFVKVFGSLSTPSQNNSTFIMDYSSNVLNRVIWYQDTICEVPLSGTSYNNSCSYTPVKTGSSIDLRGNIWRHVKIHFVRAAPGTNTGEYQIWVDGVEKAHFTNVNNNSPVGSATPNIAAITFGDYTHSNNSTWYFWIDNLTASSTFVGSGSTAPAPTPTTGSASMQWGAPTYTVSEGIGSASFTITRSGDTTGISSVNWGTYQDTASTGKDYVGVAWTTATFLAGETSKTVHLQILEDTLIEGTETFTLALANPTNGTLGATTETSVSISDNDSLGSIAPPTNLKLTQVK
jgi:hypothetical protein